MPSLARIRKAGVEKPRPSLVVQIASILVEISVDSQTAIANFILEMTGVVAQYPRRFDWSSRSLRASLLRRGCWRRLLCAYDSRTASVNTKPITFAGSEHACSCYSSSQPTPSSPYMSGVARPCFSALSSEENRTRTRPVDLDVTSRAVGVLRVLVVLRASRLNRPDIMRHAVTRQTELVHGAELQQPRIG